MREIRQLCQAEGCTQSVLAPRTLCSRHFRLVPEPIRKRIWAAVEGSVDEWEAQRAAVEAVATAEGRREPALFPDFQTEVIRR